MEFVFDAIDAIYETPAVEERWPAALEAIAKALGAAGAVLITQREASGFATTVSPALQEAQEAYNQEWWKHDFISLRSIEQGAAFRSDVFQDVDITTPEERRIHPFYVGFRQPFGLGGVMAGSVSPMPGTMVALAVQGVLGAPPFDPRAVETMHSFMKHCERALVLSCRMSELRVTNSRLEDMLSLLDCGVLQLDDTGRVVHANAAGERHLRHDLQAVGGRLSPTSPEARRAIDAAIMSALRDTPEDRLACARPIIAPRDGQRPLLLYVLPLRTEAAGLAWSPLQRIAAMVVVVDPARSVDLDPALVRDYLGLTLGEARIAAQVGIGLSPRQAASRLAISEETVRTTLKRVFSKTGVSRQNELVSLMGRLNISGEDFGPTRAGR